MLFLRKIDKNSPLKLHIGCGNNLFQGWVNIDIIKQKSMGRSYLRADLTKKMPFSDNSVDLIYSEHFIEHLKIEQGVKIFAEFFRLLKPEGMVRIATPDLDHLVNKYMSDDWRNQDWLQKSYSWIQTRAEMINVCFKEWGHQYLYNEEELIRRLKDAGFNNFSRRNLNESSHVDLQNLETRPDSRLIIEAVR